MIKLMCITTFILLCMITTSMATTNVSIGSATSSTCDSVSITIDTDDTVGIGTATIALLYDTKIITLNSVSDGILGSVEYNDENGLVRMVAIDAQSCPSGPDIIFANLEFCPVEGASGSSSLDIEVISLNNCEVEKITPDHIFCGWFRVPGNRLEGDVANNGLPITGMDAQLVAQHIVHSITLSGEDAQAADVNDDLGGETAKITGLDLQLIRQYIVHSITEFPGGVYIP